MSFTAGKNATNTGVAAATPGDKGELPAECTSTTLSSLGPVISEPYPADRPTENGTTHPAWTDPGSTTSTPGQRFPGSYPGRLDSKEDSKDVKAVTATALETAKEYVVSAGETVSGYLPESVAAYLPSATNSTHRDVDVHSTSPNPLAKNNGHIDHESETIRSQSSTAIPRDGEKELDTAKLTEESTGDVSGDTSTRSLAGSSRVGMQGMTPGTSTYGGASTPHPKDDLVGHSPQPSQVHMSDSPVTTGREYLSPLDEGKRLAGMVSPGTSERTDSAVGTAKGKERENGAASTMSTEPHPTETTSQEPAGSSTGPQATPPSDTAPTSVPQAGTSTTTAPVPTTTSDAIAGTTTTTTKPVAPAPGDKPPAHTTEAPPKKSKHRFFEKLKSKFEGSKDSMRAKGKN